MTMWSQNGNDTFSTRPGTITRGKDYEVLNTANIALELLLDPKIQNFKISSNDTDFGAFDDIVVETEFTNGDHKNYAIQLKHGENVKNLTASDFDKKNGDFTIRKYFDSSGDTTHQLILFTNRKMNNWFPSSIVVENGKLSVNFLEVKPESLLNTNINNGRCFRLQVVENETGKLVEFSLYTNQLSFGTLKNQVSEKLKKTFNCASEDFEKYYRYVNEWSNCKGQKNKLTKNLLSRVLTMVVSEPYIQAIPSSVVNQKTRLLGEAISKFDITVFDEILKEGVVKIFGDATLEDVDDPVLRKLAKEYQLDLRHLDDSTTKSKILWILDKTPLVLPLNPTTWSVVALLRSGKYILLGTNLSNLELESCNVFQNLKDLEGDSDFLNQILKVFTFSLQGKSPLQLEHLIREDSKLMTTVTTNELLQMAENSLVIGQTKEVLPFPHIPRLLSTSIVDLKFPAACDNETLMVISHVRPSFLKQLPNSCLVGNFLVSDSDDVGHNNIFVTAGKCPEHFFETVCSRKGSFKTFHHFKLTCENTLEWIATKGNVADLEVYRSEIFSIEESSLFENASMINIICADPGMGKSTLIRSLKNNICPRLWTVIMHPTDISAHFFKKPSDHLTEDFFRQVKPRYSDFEAKVFEVFREKRLLVFVWDGLDEVSSQNLELVLQIITELSKMGFKQWLTSRNHLKKQLERTFNVLSRTICKFSEDQQEAYIMQRLDNRCGSHDITIIIKKIRENLEIIHQNEVLSVPLQIHMLTELFRQNPEKYFSILGKMFSIADLYSHFINEKFGLFYWDKAKMPNDNNSAQRIISDHRSSYVKKYEKAALKLLFDQHITIKSDNFLGRIQTEGDPFGIITGISDNMMANFLHVSYAEYFAASHFCKNYQRYPLVEFIFEERYNNVRFLFDLLMARGCPAHLAVLYKNFELLQENEGAIGIEDAGGRNPLHLACSWGQKYPLLGTHPESGHHDRYVVDDKLGGSVKEESDEDEQILNFLITRCCYQTPDIIFQKSAISYADKTLSLHPLIIISKLARLKFQEFINFGDIGTVLHYSIKFGHAHMIDRLSEVPLIKTKSQGSTLVHTAVINSRITCLEKLLQNEKHRSTINYRNKYHNTPVRTACENGDIEIFELLVSAKAAINATVLHVAARHGQLSIVQLLLSKHELEVDTKDSYGNTALHEACTKDIAQFLIDCGANINERNVHQNTPLYSACVKGYKHIVQLLIHSGANINVSNVKNLTPMYVAYVNGHFDIVKLLITKGADINCIHKGKKQSLMAKACQKGDEEMVKFLITINVDVNRIESNGCTLLHNLCIKGGSVSIIKLLIESGADINYTTNKDNYRPIHVAARNNYRDIVKVLVEAGADVDSVTNSGKTCLYFACDQGHYQMVQVLIGKGADVNFCGRNGVGPLHISCERDHLEIVKLLVKSGANIFQKCGKTTPFELATKLGRAKILAFFKQVGAATKVSLR